MMNPSSQQPEFLYVSHQPHLPTDGRLVVINSIKSVICRCLRIGRIAGAQVSGNNVVTDIGGDLTISSLQDSDYYDSSQKSISGGASFSFGTMTGSDSIIASHDGMDSDYNSVSEQSCIYAGDGDFDIMVGGHTQAQAGCAAVVRRQHCPHHQHP